MCIDNSYILDNNIKAKDIAIETTRQSIILMRQANMVYYDLTMPRIYEAFARATGNYHECSDKNCVNELEQIRKEKNNSSVEVCGIKQ